MMLTKSALSSEIAVNYTGGILTAPMLPEKVDQAANLADPALIAAVPSSMNP
jgi:hypothetical protein